MWPIIPCTLLCKYGITPFSTHAILIAIILYPLYRNYQFFQHMNHDKIDGEFSRYLIETRETIIEKWGLLGRIMWPLCCKHFLTITHVSLMKKYME